MQRSFLAGLTGVLILLCYMPAMPGYVAESLVHLMRPFHLIGPCQEPGWMCHSSLPVVMVRYDLRLQ